MDFGTHLLSGIIIAAAFAHGNPVLIILALIGSILPDIGELFYWLGRVMKKKGVKLIYDDEVSESSKDLANSYYLYPYNFLHSILFVVLLIIFLPSEYVLVLTLAVSTHLFLDAISHSRATWGIMLFWPFSKLRLGVEKDWWQWNILKGKKLYVFNFISYIIVISILVLYRTI